jgi:cysteine-rich repeat protein
MVAKIGKGIIYMSIRHDWARYIGLVFLGSALLAACGDNIKLSPDGGMPDAAMPDGQPDAEYQRCGDGLVTGTEECDDSNSSDDDECLSNCMLACGDGVVNAIELCDTGIEAGQPGACPTDCDDANACTIDVLVSDSCQTRCINTDITENINGDGCCLPGSDSSQDTDCLAVCGNAVVEEGETCDIAISPGLGGACPEPADCVDGIACTTDVLVNGGTCTATCQNDLITLPINDDGCCPAGATVADDNDCSASCGDGVVSPGETCDIAIAPGDPGACPTLADCADSDACTNDTVISDGTCNAVCANTPVTVIGPADGCCPPGGNATNDPDCARVCGNGVVEAGETCDTGIAPGNPGACPEPADCVDGVACTTDVLVDGGTCTAMCQNDPITLPINDDGCCPPGATVADDNDCSASCGDGVVSPGETCDIAISPGNPGACPTLADCADADACTSDNLVSDGTCNAICSNTPITVIGPADGCCPPGGNANNDADCSPVCGNGVVESGEQCDDGNTTPGDGCDASCMLEIPPTAYRISSLLLRDPHAYTRFFLACLDITDDLNTALNNAIAGDANGDGSLDLSVLSVFRPLNQGLVTNPLDIVFGDCTAPMSGTSCAPEVGTPAVASTATNQSTGTCLAPTPGTVQPYNPPVTNATAPCYASGAHTLNLDLDGIMLQLTEGQLGATYVGNPATSMVNGLLKGFISEAEADAIILPSSLPLVGGQRLSSLLPGGTGNCASHDARDFLNGVRGWWIYFNFTADRVIWTGP